MFGRAPKGRPLQSEMAGLQDRGAGDDLLSCTPGRDAGGPFLQDSEKNEKRRKKTANAQESSSTILLGMYTAGSREKGSNSVSSGWSDMIRNGDLQARISALESLIRHHVNGDAQNHMIMYVIKYLTPLRDHYLKKLVLYFWEVVDKTDEDGNLLSEIILICSFLRNDLEHPNEYIRGLTLRFLAKVQEKELVEPLVSAVVDNLRHRVPYVRRNAALAVHAIYRRFPELLPDVVDVVEGVLYVEVDVSSRQRLFDTLADVAPARAAMFLEDYTTSHDITDGGRAFLQSVVEFARERILVSVNEKAHYVPVLFAVLQSSNDAVRYDCASTLLQLSASPSAITQAARTYIDILRQHSDNTVRLMILSQLHQMKHRFSAILQSSSLPDVLSIFHDEMGGLTDIRESVWELATHLISASTVGNFVSAIRKELRSVGQEILATMNRLVMNRRTGGVGSGGGGGGTAFGSSTNSSALRIGAGERGGGGGGSASGGLSSGGMLGGGGGGSGAAGEMGGNDCETFSPAVVALEAYRMNLLKALDTAAQRFPNEVGGSILSWLPELYLYHPALVRCNGGLHGGGGGAGGEGNLKGGGDGGSDEGATSHPRRNSTAFNTSRTNLHDAAAEERRMGGGGGPPLGQNGGGGPPMPSSGMMVWVSGGTPHPFARLAALSEEGNVEGMVVLKKILLLQERQRAAALPSSAPPHHLPFQSEGEEEKEEEGGSSSSRRTIPTPPSPFFSSSSSSSTPATAAALARLREVFPKLAQSNVLRAALWVLGAFSPPDPSPAAANPLLFRLQSHSTRGGAVPLPPLLATPEEEATSLLASDATTATTLRGAAAVLAMLRQALGPFPLTAPTKTVHDTVEEVVRGVPNGGEGGGIGGAGAAAMAAGMRAVTTVMEDGTYGTTYVPLQPSSNEEGAAEPMDASASGPFSEEEAAAGRSGGVLETADASPTPTPTTPLHCSFLRAMVVEGDGFLITALASAIVRLVQTQAQSANGEVAREVGVEMLQEILRYGESVWYYHGTEEERSLSLAGPATTTTTTMRGGSVRSGLVARRAMEDNGGATALFESDTKEQLRVSIAMLSSSVTEETTSPPSGAKREGGMTLSAPPGVTQRLLQGTLACSKTFLTPSVVMGGSGGEEDNGRGGRGGMASAVERLAAQGKTLHDLLPPSSLLCRVGGAEGRGHHPPHTQEEEEEEEPEPKRHAFLRGGGPPRLLDALVSSESTHRDHHPTPTSSAITPALLSMWRRSVTHPLAFALSSTPDMAYGTDAGMEGEEEEEEDEEEEEEEGAMVGGSRRYGREVVHGGGGGGAAWKPAGTSTAGRGSGTRRTAGGWAPSSSALVGGSIAPPPSYVVASRRYLQRLEKAVPLSGTSDPIYCECSVKVQEFHLTIHWRLINCSSSFLDHIVIDLISLGGIKLCERPQVVSLKPYEQLTMSTSLRADGTETGVIFGYLLFDYPGGNSACLVLNNIEVDILTYVHPVTDMTQEVFRRKWRASDWENRIVIGTTVDAVQKATQKRLDIADESSDRGGGSRRTGAAALQGRGVGEEEAAGAGEEERATAMGGGSGGDPSGVRAATVLEMYVALLAECLNVGRSTTEMDGEEERMAQWLGIEWPLSFSSGVGGAGGGGGDAMVQVSSLEKSQHANKEDEADEKRNDTDGPIKGQSHSSPAGEGKKEAGSCVSCNLAARTTFGEDLLVQVSVECDNTGPTALVNGGTISGIVRIRSSTHTVAYGVGKKLNTLHSELSLLSGQ